MSDGNQRDGELERFAVDCALYAAWWTEYLTPTDPDYGFVDFFEAATARNIGCLHGFEELAVDIEERGILPPAEEGQARLVTDGGEAEHCPVCDSPAADVSWQTAPHQSVCGTDDCPVNTWDSSTPRPDQRWDGRLEESDLRNRATRAWGPDAQKNKAAEECSELAAALNRDLNSQQDREKLLEEFIDARVMLWQLTLMFTEEELEAALGEALDDLAHRLEVYG